MAVEDSQLTVRDASAWRRWLDGHHGTSDGVWLVLAKKGATKPTSLTYDLALEEALCYGWIDGQARRRDESTYSQRFTPRRRRSVWSKRNTERAERLMAAGRMHPAGIAEIERARTDGRWDAAYTGQARMQMPPELAAALSANAKARATFEALDSRNRYAILYRLTTAKRAETRARRLAQYVDMLARGDAIYPRKGAIVAGQTFVTDPRVDAYIDSLPEWQQAICRRVRALVHAADPEVEETIKRTNRPYFVLQGNVCALLAAKDHVNVFLYDPIVPDPEGIITSGHENKTARTMAIRQGDPINERALTAMCRAIITNNRAGGWRKLTPPR
jgi:uncharacterized protein YdeI (YjbR/CyaY-like superfamily)